MVAEDEKLACRTEIIMWIYGELMLPYLLTAFSERCERDCMLCQDCSVSGYDQKVKC